MNPMLKSKIKFKPVVWYSYGELVSSKMSLSGIAKPYLAENNPWLNYLSDYSVLKSNNAFLTYLDILMQELYARYWTHMAVCVESKDDVGLSLYSSHQNECDEFIAKIVMVIRQTYDRYSKLLAIYTSEKDKLLDGVKIKTTGTGQFNDTPQNVQSVAEAFGDNSHISNITKSDQESTSDVETKIRRIDEIDRLFKNIIRDWTNEFDGLFVESENVL